MTNTIQFLDKQLEKAIRKVTKPTGKITDKDVKNITQLIAYDCGIEYLTGIENLTNLERLKLGENKIVDVSPLENLTSLFYLDLGHNQIVDISPLSGLTMITYLYLFENRIVDISPLSELTKLYELSIKDNNIVDVTPIEKSYAFREGSFSYDNNPFSQDLRKKKIIQQQSLASCMFRINNLTLGKILKNNATILENIEPPCQYCQNKQKKYCKGCSNENVYKDFKEIIY